MRHGLLYSNGMPKLDVRDALDVLEVLIVGAGPVGLFLANECARRGLKYQLIEARPAQSEHSKALAVMPRTLEILDMAGVAAGFLQAANRVTWAAIHSHQHSLAKVRFEPEDSPYPFVAMVPQNVTEAILLKTLRGRGGDVTYNTELKAASENGGVVTATVQRAGASGDIQARYLIGCDGAHSAVRHLTGIGFDGAEYPGRYLLADIETNPLDAAAMQLCPSDQGPLALFPMHATRSRVVASILEPQGDAPTLELVQQELDRRGPGGVTAKALHWSAYFAIHHRCAAALRQGPMFLAGDAAHIHSPMGGQGMNTGLQDTWNLAWKLEWVIAGRAGDQLLDTYAAERLPVIRHVIETTDRITRIMGTPHRAAQALRDLAFPVIARLPAFKRAFVQNLSELGVAYTGSPLVEGAGERFWDESLRGGTGLARRFVLFADSGNAGARQLCLESPELVEFRASKDGGLRLLRPDGYLAYAAPDVLYVPASLRDISALLRRATAGALGAH